MCVSMARDDAQARAVGVAPEPFKYVRYVIARDPLANVPHTELCELVLRRLVTSRKGQFRWRNPERNPYLMRGEDRKFFESRYADVAFALSNA